MSSTVDLTTQAKSDFTHAEILALGRAARAATKTLATSDIAQRNAGLLSVATALRERAGEVQAANQSDYGEAEANGTTGAMLDRLLLNEERIEALAQSTEAIAAFRDPLRIRERPTTRPNGLQIQRVPVPLGVIGIIYESRPNVTLDAAALCLKASNAVILRGGSECVRTNRLLAACFAEGLREVGLPADSAQLLPTQDHVAVGWLLDGLDGCVDVLVPRGGRRLIERVQKDARVPVIGHLEGLCHVYVHEAADAAMASAIVVNAKMRRTGVCGAAETLLIDRSIAAKMLPQLIDDLQKAGCNVLGDADAQQIVTTIKAAKPADWTTEYLDAVISVAVVDDIDAALEHIDRYGSGHTDSIVTGDSEAADYFLRSVDSAIVMHNASTQYADGGEFGMGAEIGIATGRVHARGPVGADELTSYKYQVRGAGQTRP